MQLQTPRYKVTTKGRITTVLWLNKPKGLPVARGVSPSLMREAEEDRARAARKRRRRANAKAARKPEPSSKKKRG